MLIAALLTLALTLVALAHFYWACGGVWPGRDPESLAAAVVGIPGMTAMPPRPVMFAVAFLLALMALWPLALAPLAGARVGAHAVILGHGLLAAIFLGRGVAGYSPYMRRRHRAEPFARNNRRYFSPLCLLLGGGFLALLF